MKIWTDKKIKEILKKDKNFCMRAMLKLFGYQTENEKRSERTISNNNVGFNSPDAKKLTCLCKTLQRNGSLNNYQMNIVYEKMQKYHKQITDIANKIEKEKIK